MKKPTLINKYIILKCWKLTHSLRGLLSSKDSSYFFDKCYDAYIKDEINSKQFSNLLDKITITSDVLMKIIAHIKLLDYYCTVYTLRSLKRLLDKMDKG